VVLRERNYEAPRRSPYVAGRKGPTQKGDKMARFDQQAAVRIGPDSLPADSTFQKTLLCILRSR
jgi:hypothetical protein